MVAYLGYTLRMRTLFRGWPIMVNDTHTRRRRRLASVNSCAHFLFKPFNFKSCFMTLCTQDMGISSSWEICVTVRWECGWSSWLCTRSTVSTFSTVRALRGRPLPAERSTEPNLSTFCSKCFNPPSVQFLFRNSFNTCPAVYCFSSLKTLIKCLSSSENSILNDFTITSSSVVMVNFVVFQLQWSVPKIMKIIWKLVKVMYKNLLDLFFPDTV